jgi:hypothetical protein
MLSPLILRAMIRPLALTQLMLLVACVRAPAAKLRSLQDGEKPDGPSTFIKPQPKVTLAVPWGDRWNFHFSLRETRQTEINWIFTMPRKRSPHFSAR